MSETDKHPEPTRSPVEETPHPWRDLSAETLQLLQLNPLSTDREQGPRPLRFVQLGSVERHGREQSLLRLSIVLPGQATHRSQNGLEVWADHRSREVRFGPESGLQTEPADRGLGRFLLAQGAAWARRRWGPYRIEGGALKPLASEAAQRRRDHALEAQGFTVEYDESPPRARYSARDVNALGADWNRERVQLVPPVDAAAMLQNANERLQAQEINLREQQERIRQLSRDDGALRFTIACLVAFVVFQAGLLIWVVTR